MEVGLATFADLASGVSPRQRMRELMEEVELADQLGLDVFGIGEHHRADFLVSSPAVVLGAAAVRTDRIRLSSAVTVLSSDDPVRVFQDFAEVDLLSNGRAEIMAGRGSFIESFPLFGYDLDDYDELYAEKLELLLALREQTRVTWSGRHRPALLDAGVWPRPVQEPLPVWVAVGGSPQSVVRAGTLGLPLTRTRRSARGRLARAGRGEDPVRARAVRSRPLHRPDERRRDRARRRAALDGAVRHRGRAARARGDRAPHARQQLVHLTAVVGDQDVQLRAGVGVVVGIAAAAEAQLDAVAMLLVVAGEQRHRPARPRRAGLIVAR